MKVEKQLRTEAGSCSECQDRTEPEVFNVDLKTVSLRLCAGCKQKLAEQLIAAK